MTTIADSIEQFVRTVREFMTADTEHEQLDMLDRMAASKLPQPLKQRIFDAMTGARMAAAS